jgi:hypothetical protein
MWPFTEKQPETKTTIRLKAIKMLKEQGSITNRDLVRITNGQTWLTSDLRKEGYILPFQHDTWENSSKGARFKRYYYSGKDK